MQILRNGFVIDCFACERKHTLYKSHIGLHRFEQLARKENGEFVKAVLTEIYRHHMEALKKFSFQTKLVGPTFQHEVACRSLGDSNAKAAREISAKGREIQQGHVLLGEHPGLVECAIESGDQFFLVLQIIEQNMETSNVFMSRWTKTGRTKILPIQLAARSPMWWLHLDDATLLCLH